MQTQTQTRTSSFSANLSELPILKHFDQNQIQTNVDTFRKGEKNLFWFLKLAVLGLIGWGVWTYVLPPIFMAIGQILAAAATVIIVGGLIFAAPVIFKGVRRLTRALHKAIIKYDPFAQLEDERKKMLQNQQIFRVSKSNIASLRSEMEINAKQSEAEAIQGQENIVRLQSKAQTVKAKMDKLIAQLGENAKTEDEYVNLASDFQKILAEASRVKNKTDQAKELVQKYGARAAIMKKLGQNLTLVETKMEIKIQDFDATVEMLKKDYEFAQKANAATSAAKRALGFSKGWEVDYALDVVTSTIAADIAITSGNLRDIEALTTNYNLDSDDLYENLNKIADKIKIGGDVIPQAKVYTNPDYKLTQDDKLKSGGFDNIF